MNYSPDEIMQYVEEEDVSFIRLAFCDIYGKQRNLAIMPTELRRAFRTGIAIDASAIPGFGGEVRSDLFLHPNPDTLVKLPWRPETGSVVRMFCDITYPDGTPMEADARHLLKLAVQKAEKAGIYFSFGAEMEFYLFKTDDDGEPTKTPYDHAGYMDIAPEDKGENIRREICLTLSKMGIRPESSHHEEGPGQNEVDFRYSDPITAADQAITFRSVVQTVAMRNGLCADFSPKPLPNAPGSGLHVNISMTRKDSDEDLLPYAIAGILEHIQDMTLFLNPCDASYARLGSHKAPGFISWSHENRSQLIRIPAADTPDRRRAELRSADPAANPYFAFALLIHAALDGIERRLIPAPATDRNLYDAPGDVLSRVKKLPTSLGEAKAVAASSTFLRSVLPQRVIDFYTQN